MQTTNHILMIRPVDFKFNEQTAGNNKFQQASEQDNVQEQALTEFDGFVSLLRRNDVDVTVINDTLDPETPDSIFPNNWISFHENGEIFLYPMFSENRRKERRKDILDQLGKSFKVSKITDLSVYENQELYLEGTGSMVLDRLHKTAYACISLRTDKQLLLDWCEKAGYTPVTFKADDKEGFPIYHTNVMMCIGDRFAVICLETIQNPHEREMVMQHLIRTGLEIIEISIDQMAHFAGNMLQIANKNGTKLLVMSEQAYLALNATQIFLLEKYSKLIYAPLYTIEKNGGGSARCMLAEIHLEER
jgi:hypothetical protein